ncbi:bitesize [Rhodnius prolixus]|uniref:bitesize n=1 Tax=Rhodnius prolixus TaxID=13249 RepID=UPI003D18BA7E
MAATCLFFDERLKAELQTLRRKGAVCANSNSNNLSSGVNSTAGATGGRRRCGRCRGELGRIINRGLCCPGCRLRVCKSCRQYLEHSPTVQWLCTLCQYHLEEKSASGDWMKEFVKQPSDSGGRSINSTETIKRTIQRSWTFSDVSPSPWCYLRGSPEMRAYSSMPRHQDCEFICTPDFTKPPIQIASSEQSIQTKPLLQQGEETTIKANVVEDETQKVMPLEVVVPEVAVEDEETLMAEQPMLQSSGELVDSSYYSNPVPEEERSPMRPQNSSPSPVAPSSPASERSLQRHPTPSPTAQLFRKVALRIDARNLPPGVTPPRSRRRLLTAGEIQLGDDSMDTGQGFIETSSKVLLPDSDGYKLVYISSSDSSSREELQSDDGCYVDRSGGELSSEDCDWDYFECWQGSNSNNNSNVNNNSRVRLSGCNSQSGGDSCSSDGSTAAHDRLAQLAGVPVDYSVAAGVQCSTCPPNLVPLHVPIPVPFPVPVPVFFPVPVSLSADRHGETMNTHLLPDSETLPLDELLCNKALSPLISADQIVQKDRKGETETEESVVLKVYKNLDTTDYVLPTPAPEDMLRLSEAKLRDFTDYRDDNSLSSISSSGEENERHTPSKRIYTLNPHSSEDDETAEEDDENGFSEEFSLAVTPPRSLTSCSTSSASTSEDDEEKKSFKRTYVLCEDDDSDDSEEANSSEDVSSGEIKENGKEAEEKPLLENVETIEEITNSAPLVSKNIVLVVEGDVSQQLSCINSGGSEQDLDTTSVGGLGGLLSSGATLFPETTQLQPDVEWRPQNLHQTTTTVTDTYSDSDREETVKVAVQRVMDNAEQGDDEEEPEAKLNASQTESLLEESLTTCSSALEPQSTSTELGCNSTEMLSSSEPRTTGLFNNRDEISDRSLLSEFSVTDKTVSSSSGSIFASEHQCEVIESIITFSNVEVFQVCSEFLEAEKKFSEICAIVADKSGSGASGSDSEEVPAGGIGVGTVEMLPAAVTTGPENTSDEFSGTESMEMPLEDLLERSIQERGEDATSVTTLPVTISSEPTQQSAASGKYTSLVMITQQEHASAQPSPPNIAVTNLEEEKSTVSDMVRVVTGTNTLSNVVCLEEGLADDDSWVEDLDREEVVTTTEDSSEEEAFPDREEELRGYHRSAIDFTLHTIAEESCEESEVEAEKNKPTELEKYFFYGLGENATNREEREIDTMSETSSIYSGGMESNSGGVEEPADGARTPGEDVNADTASSRLEKYFLSAFMGFNRRDSDGSVGSDSEGRPSPEQRRKRLVRRGTGRPHSSSLDNLTDTQAESVGQGDTQNETEASSTETDSHDEQVTSFDKVDGQFDTVKRTKKKKRSVPSMSDGDLMEVPENYPSGSKEELNHSTDEGGGKKTPRPDTPPSELTRNKQQSRDSGFVGSCDDLLKETRETAEPLNNKEIPSNPTEVSNEPCPPPTAALSRKDSFNNWSSDEETNLMMSKMRAFFKTMVGSQPKGASPNLKPKTKPPQLVYFESELTRLMKTVPGIRDEQVREIVEYLSSEDTWSDSYDSSDYTSSDLEISNKRSALQEEISASCRQIISNFESGGGAVVGELMQGECSPPPEQNTALVCQRLVASFSRMEAPKCDSTSQNSPPLIEKVMQHIGTRLWALMHEVSGGEGSSPRINGRHRRLTPKLSATSTTEEEEEEEAGAEEVEDDSVDNYSPLPRSKSHDPLLEENRQETSDNERFSWRGSFESALMASDSRTRLAESGVVSSSQLALAAKRRSHGDLMFKSFSREQLDRVRSCGSIGGSVEDKIWARQKRRRSSVPDSGGGSGGSGGSADGEEDSDCGGGTADRATLPRSLQASSGAGAATNSLPRLPTTPVLPQTTIYKSHSVHQFTVKSARYRPPGYRGSPVAPPPRRDRRARSQTASQSSLSTACDDASICSEPVGGRAAEEEVDRLINHHRATALGARSDSLASVYSGAGEGRHIGVPVKGEVQFGLQYNYKQSSLEIHVKQCKDLAPVDIKRNRSDPYVKVYLLPDKSKSGKRKTRVKKHTLNPIFDEVLKFQVSLEGLEHRTLWLSVWHSDMFGRNDFLGEVLMPLENKVFDDPNYKFYTLQERSEMVEELHCRGELIVGLKYETPDENSQAKKRPSKGCLYVLIKEAKNLPAVKSNGTSDPFCKSYLLPDKGRSSKQKAPVVRKSCNPSWHHTFTYHNVSMDELAERSLELTIWDHDRLASNEFLGGVRLNIGTGKHQGRLVDWMDASGNEVTLWQRMIEKPNFWVESCLPLRPSLDLRTNP